MVRAVVKRLLVGMAGAVVVALMLATLVLAAALQRAPAVVLETEIGTQEAARVLGLLRGHDPRRARPGQQTLALLQARDLDVLMQHGLRRWLNATGRVQLNRGQARVALSVPLPDSLTSSLFGRWLNLELELVATGRWPAVQSLRLGRLPLPAALAERALPWLAQRAGWQSELTLAGDVVQRVSFVPGQLQVVYAWRDDSAARVMGTLLPPADQQRLRSYSDHLVQVVARQGPGWTVSLAPLVGPVFQLARQRSEQPGADAAAENRAALVVLTLFANGRGVGALLPEARAWPRARPLRVTLGGRDDFPRHLLVSATLAAEGTGPLSRAIGLYKEVTDARSGSGFSFNDMAANRAGTRLGEWAVAQPRRLQAALADGVQESDLLPAWQDLPEFLTEAELQRRYGGVGGAAYETLLEEIDRRVAALPVFR